MRAWPIGLLLAGPAQGDGGTAIALHWDAPVECPSQQELQHRLQPKIERIPATTDEPLRVNARVTRQDGKFHTELHLWRGTGERMQTLVTDTCQTAAEAALLMITVAAEDPSMVPSMVPRSPSASQEDEPPAASPPLPEPVAPEAEVPEPQRPEVRVEARPGGSVPSDAMRSPSVVEPPPAEPPTAPTRPRRRSWAVRLAAGVELGSLPGVGPGGAASFALLWPRVRLELGAQGWLPRRREIGSATARISLVSAVVKGCYVPTVRRLELPACVGTEVGAMIGTADGVDSAATVPLPWAAGTVGVSVQWRPAAPSWSRLAIFTTATMAIAWTRPRFEIEQLGRVHRTGAVGARFTAGTEIRF